MTLLTSFFALLLIPNLAFGAMRHFSSAVVIPEFWDGSSGAIAINFTALDADGEKLAFVMQAPKTGNIRKVCMRTGSVTTGGELESRLETVNLNTGNPSGTLFCANSSTNTYVADTTDNTWVTSSAFPSDCPVTKGDFIAVVWQRNPGSTFNGGTSRNSDYSNDFSYSLSSASASGYVKAANSGPVQVEYDDGTYGFSPSIIPMDSFGAYSISSNTSPSQLGIRISVPFRTSVSGVWVHTGGVSTSAVSSADLLIYDRDGVSLLCSTLTISMAYAASTVLDNMWFVLPESVIFEANVYYRVVLKGKNTNSFTLVDYSTKSDAVMASVPFGQNIHLSSGTTITGESSWSNNTLRRPLMGIVIDGIDTDHTKSEIYDSTIYNGTFQ